MQALLVESREQNKCMQFEVEDLKQKLQDARGDIKVHFTNSYTTDQNNSKYNHHNL